MNCTTGKEVWKDIKGYEGYYQISNLGRVKSLDRVVEGRWGDQRIRGRILKQSPNTWGYMQVCLKKNNIPKTFRVHRLVAEYFIHNPNNLPEVNHIDENKTNNKTNNLEWCTTSENHLHGTMPAQRSINAFKNKHLIKANKKKKRRVKGTHLKTGEIRIYDYVRLADKDGFNAGCISNVCSGRSSHHKGWVWKYID